MLANFRRLWVRVVEIVGIRNDRQEANVDGTLGKDVVLTRGTVTSKPGRQASHRNLVFGKEGTVTIRYRYFVDSRWDSGRCQLSYSGDRQKHRQVNTTKI